MIILTVFVGLFMYDNAEFFATAQDNIQAGYEVKYVGKQNVNPDVHSLSVGDKVFFTMGKPK